MKNSEFSEKNLIFIASQPRSGSTYLQNILSNNSDTNTSSESWLLLNFANQIAPSLYKADFDFILAKDAFDDYLSKYPEFNFPFRQKEFILSLYQPMANNYKFVIDKTPRYWEILEKIPFLFPSSKIIVLKRNPIEVAKSMINTWKLDSLNKLNYFRRDLLLAPVKIQNFCEENKDNKNIYVIKYEDLISDTERETKKIYEWLGMSYTNSVLKVGNNKFKGKFGDPFLNSEKGYLRAKLEGNSDFLLPKYENFLIGYSHYLGTKFLNNYGSYGPMIKSKRTMSFSHFLHLGYSREKEYDIRKELLYLLKETYYKIFD